MSLTYKGTGENIINVPAHDLSDVEIETLAQQSKMSTGDYIAMLTKNGLYAVNKPRKSVKTEDNKAEDNDV